MRPRTRKVVLERGVKFTRLFYVTFPWPLPPSFLLPGMHVWNIGPPNEKPSDLSDTSFSLTSFHYLSQWTSNLFLKVIFLLILMVLPCSSEINPYLYSLLLQTFSLWIFLFLFLSPFSLYSSLFFIQISFRSQAASVTTMWLPSRLILLALISF